MLPHPIRVTTPTGWGVEVSEGVGMMVAVGGMAVGVVVGTAFIGVKVEGSTGAPQLAIDPASSMTDKQVWIARRSGFTNDCPSNSRIPRTIHIGS
jgi:hypothetical protein